MGTIKIDLDQETIEALASIKIAEILEEYLPKVEDNIQPDLYQEGEQVSLEEYYERLGVRGDEDLSLDPYSLSNYARGWD